MSLSDLKKIQFIYPGLYTFWVLYFIIKATFIETNPFDNYKYYVICLTISTLYHTFNARELLFTPIKRHIIESNIRDQMAIIFASEVELKQKRAFMIFLSKLFQKETNQDSHCMNCFYSCIDNDNTLKVRSEIVMFNGSILSCIIDTTIISAFILLLLLLDYLIDFYVVDYNKVLSLLLPIFLISLCLLPISISSHIGLSNNQLKYIYKNRNKLKQVNDIGDCTNCN